jgi:hypothetical protein
MVEYGRLQLLPHPKRAEGATERAGWPQPLPAAAVLTEFNQLSNTAFKDNSILFRYASIVPCGDVVVSERELHISLG